MTDVSEKIQGKKADTLQFSIYSIYDCMLGVYDAPFAINSHNLDDFMSRLVNDVQSKYYGKESDFSIVRVGTFDNSIGVILGCDKPIEVLGQLDKYIDQKQRNLQTIIQTLNFLPTGYFKMPEELKKDIQSKIDDSIKTYVENYVIPDLDVNDITRIKRDINYSKTPSECGYIPDDDCGIGVSSDD